MRTFLLFASFLVALSVQAQPTRDANPRGEQNTQGAQTEGNALDPATKARQRTEGAAGGTGARVPDEARGAASVGSGKQNRKAKPPEDESYDTSKTRRHNETSSDREEGRGARGAIR